MDKPAVGRIVHYVSYGSPDGRFKSEPRAAIITEVSDAREHAEEVGICVLNPTGMYFDRQVRHDEHPNGESTGQPGTWHWPERI